MGSELNLRMEGYLRQRILNNTDIFLPVTEETLRSTEGRKYFRIKTGDEESSIRLVRDAGRTTALFTYPIDIDGDPKNGRLYLEDRFVFDSYEKKLIGVGRSFRDGSGKGAAPWEDLLKRLRTRVPDLDPKDEAVKRFFSRVVLQLPDPILEEILSEKPPLPARITRIRPLPPSSRKSPKPVGLLERAALEQARSGKALSWADRVDQLTQELIEQLPSSSMIVSLFMGASAFRLAERGVLFQKGAERGALLLATGAGLLAEAPAFEIAHRIFHRPFPGREDGASFVDGVLLNYLTFGALRGAGLTVGLVLARIPERSLLYGDATFPLLHHTASFAMLHGVQEAERIFRPRGDGRPWTERLLEDGVFYLQTALANRLVGGMLVESWTVRESEAVPHRVSRVPELQSLLAAEAARAEELEGRLRRLRESSERVLENAETRDRENATLHSSLQEALRRAKEFQGRVEKLEARLRKNKEGTEKVVEWARLKERENDSLRASLQDALGKLEELSAEKDRLATDLEEMKREFVRRDQEAMGAERRADDLEAKVLVLEEEGARARFGSEPPPEQRISTIVLKGPDPEVSDRKEK